VRDSKQNLGGGCKLLKVTRLVYTTFLSLNSLSGDKDISGRVPFTWEIYFLLSGDTVGRGRAFLIISMPEWHIWDCLS